MKAKGQKEIHERFEQEIEYANKDIDFADGSEEENYMRGYLGGLLCAYRLVFGKSYEEVKEEVKQDCDNCHFNIDNEYCRFREKFPEEKICKKWKEDK